jgi:hypothetical protein
MVKFVLSLADVLRLKFTISPLGEAVRLARALANQAEFAQGAQAAWLREQRPALKRLAEQRDLRPLLAVLSGRDYFPDFLVPTPSGDAGVIDDELERVEATPAHQVEQEIGRCLDLAAGADASVKRKLRSPEAGVLLADLLWSLWEIVIAPAWPHCEICSSVTSCIARDSLGGAGLHRCSWISSRSSSFTSTSSSLISPAATARVSSAARAFV